MKLVNDAKQWYKMYSIRVALITVLVNILMFAFPDQGPEQIEAMANSLAAILIVILRLVEQKNIKTDGKE